ncbi:fluoride efflux transporter FluC [Microlunatus ginsengisoli]|uniref:Fluoride-specific ion channel FluC n=1 Tax=Microlunatus ginsengisoli TaxID=363863 RepID=A0ABP6ZDY5_9ACTN
MSDETTGEQTPVPVESDAERDDSAAARARPAHHSFGNIVLVAAGGAIGTGLRYAVSLAVPAQSGVPVGIFLINITGAFLLGLLLEFLADTSLDVGWSRRARLGIGTGVMGGYTTYSALAADTVTLGLAHPVWAAAYAVGTVVIGGLASVAGVLLARHQLRPALALRRTSK